MKPFAFLKAVSAWSLPASAWHRGEFFQGSRTTKTRRTSGLAANSTLEIDRPATTLAPVAAASQDCLAQVALCEGLYSTFCALSPGRIKCDLHLDCWFL